MRLLWGRQSWARSQISLKYEHRDTIIRHSQILKSKNLGAYSGPDRRELGATSCRNLKKLGTSIRHSQFLQTNERISDDGIDSCCK